MNVQKITTRGTEELRLKFEWVKLLKLIKLTFYNPPPVKPILLPIRFKGFIKLIASGWRNPVSA